MADKEKTNEELQAEIEALKKASADKEVKLQADIEALKKKSDADQKLRQEIEDLKRESANKEELLKQAHEALSESASSSSSKRPVYTHKKEKYVQVVPKSTVKRDGKVITVTADLLRKDKGLLAYLIDDVKSGILVKESDLKPAPKEKEG